MTRAALTRVAVFGGGQVALLAATALARTLPRTRIVLVTTQVEGGALADLAHTSLPSLARLHRRIGIDEAGMLRRAAASHRLAIRYRNWRANGGDWTIGYGAAPDPVLSGGFATQWQGAAAAARETTPSGPAAALAQQERFAAPSDDLASPLADLDYALRFDPEGHTRRLRSLAGHLGIETLAGAPAAVERDADGLVTAYRLDDGRRVAADLFVDASGPAAALATLAGDAKVIDWSRQLPVDRIYRVETPPRLSPLDEVTARADGYVVESPGRDATRRLLCRASALGGDPRAEWDSGVAISRGRLAAAWTGTVVSIGDAAARFEPLGWCNLHLATCQIELLLELLPGRDIEPLERAEYNRRTGLIADRVRDFVALHHAAPGATAFAALRLERSATLARTIDEHERRGHHPYFEEESIPRDLWLEVLTQAGFAAGPNARAIAVDAHVRDDLRRRHADRVAAAVAAGSPYAAWLTRALETAG